MTPNPAVPGIRQPRGWSGPSSTQTLVTALAGKDTPPDSAQMRFMPLMRTVTNPSEIRTSDGTPQDDQMRPPKSSPSGRTDARRPSRKHREWPPAPVMEPVTTDDHHAP